MREYRLLIADSDKAYALRLTHIVEKHPRLKVIGCACDGVNALKMIHASKPDIILLDLLLPEMDGMSVLKAVQQMKTPPTIVCMSQFYTSISVEMARKYGACYYMYKPLNMESLSGLLVECTDTVQESRKMKHAASELSQSSEIHRRIHEILQELGFSSKHNGSGYIADSVALAAESPMILHNLSSGLYRQLAAQRKVSAACVERSIRTAIACANTDGRLTAAIGSEPTNKTFIRYVLRTLNLHA